MISGWSNSLGELSQPHWRPPTDLIPKGTFQWDVSGKTLVPAIQTLESVGKGFVAAWVHWWQVRGKKPTKLLGAWYATEKSEFGNPASVTAEDFEKFRRLVELAHDQQLPIWVEGDSNSTQNTEGAPTYSRCPRMFTWIVVANAQQAVLEVGFDPDRNRITSRDREVYLRGLHLIRDELSRTMSSIPSSVSISPLSFLEKSQSHPRAEKTAATSIASLMELACALDSARRETIQKIEGHLASLEGTRFDSLKGNQMLAKSLQGLLDSHGFRVRCPECGEPAIMRCLAAGNSPTGSFVFDHVLSHGRTFHGGRSSIPKLEVVAKPVRQAMPVE